MATLERFTEHTTNRGRKPQIDAAAGIIKGVKIIGNESANGRTYPPETLAKARDLYEGAKVNVNHPRGKADSPRDYQDRIGVLRNVVIESEGLSGDFHFNPKHHLAEQLAWDAANAPENVGFSHNAEGRTARRGKKLIVEEIVHVHSVDLVADPATNKSLFEGRIMPTEKKLSDVLKEVKAETAGHALLSALLEDDMVPADMPVASEPEASGEDMVKSALKQAFLKIVESVFDDDSLDAKATIAAIKERTSGILKAVETSSGKKPEGGSDTPAPDSTPEAKQAATDRKLALLEARDEVRDLIEQEGVTATKQDVDDACALPTLEARKRFIAKLPKRSADKPRSTAPLKEQKETKLPEFKTAKERAAFLRR